MHAVVGIWTMDEARRDEQTHLLHNEIVPLVKTQPGFVSGHWMDDPRPARAIPLSSSTVARRPAGSRHSSKNEPVRSTSSQSSEPV
jgi:hypothetical protein